MREWDDVGRHLGPHDPYLGPEDLSSRRTEAGTDEPPDDSRSERPPDPEDEFDPRYCVRCRKRIPVLVSERQDACDACLVELERMARGLAPEAMPPGPGELPPCPNCGGRAVEREWRTDWILRAVDMATEMASFFFANDRYGRPLDGNSEVGPAKVMTYHCLQCDERWKPRR